MFSNDTLLPSTTRFAIVPAGDGKQALRLQRFFMSVATYAACGVFAQLVAWLGYLPPMLPLQWMLGAAVTNGVIYGLLRSGWNLRLRDPSLTEPQLILSMLAVMVLVYHAEVRGAFLMLAPVPLLFGVLRLRLFQLARVGVTGIVAYACVIALLMVHHPGRVHIQVEMLNMLALAGVMGFVCVMGGYISGVRARLSHSNSTIREMAQRDALTGVGNRRHLMETLEREIARCERGTRDAFALCMIDIDHFKRINDSFGHQVGDRVLAAVAECIGDSVRESDYLARYGGEEFVVLLDLLASDSPERACERIRANVAQLCVAQAGNAPLSVSLGLADYADGDTSASLLARADKALYRAKAAGRNRIERAEAPALPSPCE